MRCRSGRVAAHSRPTAGAFPGCTFPPDSPEDECGNRKTDSLLSHEFLPDAKLAILRKDDFGGEDTARCEIARGDVFLVFDVLTRIDQHASRNFFDCVIV